jgi:hypothetical protein
MGIRTGNWLSVRQAQHLLNAPDVKQRSQAQKQVT